MRPRGRVCVVGLGGTHAHTLVGANNRYIVRNTLSPPNGKHLRTSTRTRKNKKDVLKNTNKNLHFFLKLKHQHKKKI